MAVRKFKSGRKYTLKKLDTLEKGKCRKFPDVVTSSYGDEEVNRSWAVFKKRKEDGKKRFFRYGSLNPIPIEILLHDEIYEKENEDILIQINRSLGITALDWKEASDYIKKKFGEESGALWVANNKNRAILYAMPSGETEEFEELLKKAIHTEDEKKKLNEVISLYQDEINEIKVTDNSILLAKDFEDGYLFLFPVK